MRVLLVLNVFAFAGLFTSLKAQISPTQMQCEYLENPSVVDVLNPRLSWVNIAKDSDKGQLQTA
jgi:alpha-L-rhamnosidase